MIIVEMQTAHIAVATDPTTGNRILIMADDQSGIQIKATLTPEGARQIGTALSTALHVAGSSLPTQGPKLQ